MRILNPITVLLVIVALFACAPQGSQESPEIAAGSVAWQEGLNAGDIEAVVSIYTDDARVMPPNAELAQGHDAVRTVFGGMIDAGLTGSLATLEIRAAADIGYHVGTYSLQTPDGSVADRGKFIEIWRKVDGDWKISSDTFNSDLPVMASAGSTMVVTHEVEDPERWLAAWQGEGGRHEMFAQHGAPNVRVFQGFENPDLTALIIDVEDMDALQAFLVSPVGVAAKAEDGVIDATMKILGEVR